MGLGFHRQSSDEVDKFNQLLEQMLRCIIHQDGGARKWIDMLELIEYAVNQTPNRTIGYSGFNLNYGHHPVSVA